MRLLRALRPALTVLVTLLVVLCELGLLHAVYVRGTPTRQADVVVVRLAGELAIATPADAARVVLDGRAALTTMAHLGVSDQQLAPARAALTEFATTPSRTNLTRARTAVTVVTDDLAASTRRLTVVADLIYVVLLIVASLGWMWWFRRLVARHRSMQQALTEHQLTARSEQRLAALVRNSADLVLVCDLDGAVRFATPSTWPVLGLAPDTFVSLPCGDLAVPDDREQFAAVLATLAVGEDRAVSVRMRHADGRVLDMEGTVSNLVGDPAVDGLVVTVRDITARVELEHQLKHQAFHDPLTNLANRQLFSDRLAHALRRRTGERPLVVLFCDLDEFKNVNDSLGHTVGDQVLTEVARRALSVFRRGDTVARLGGDEFAVLLEDTTLETAMVLAEHLLATLSDPIDIDGNPLIVRASIGVSSTSTSELSGTEVLRNADVAMYLAKERGRGTIAVYDSELHTQQLERLELRADLQNAIRNDELVVHYQPTIDLGTGEIAGFEALVRWAHPTRGLVAPDEFIPIAEKTGLIHSLGSVVLRTACRAAVDFTALSARPVSIAVNVAAQQLERPDFVDEVTAVLAEVGLPGHLLTLEITESVLLHNIGLIVSRLHRLRLLGIRIAVDDFGTGYSSLSYLRDLPLDVLKVDKAFIDRVTTDPHDAALAEAIVTMSHSMGLVTVAEGVEIRTQAMWLARTRCTYGQGYLWSPAVSREDATALLAAQSAPAERELAPALTVAT